MPPKKAAGPATKKATTSKPTVNGTTKAKATKKAAAKAPSKTATKAATKAPAKPSTEATTKAPAKTTKAAPKSTTKVAANTGKKRKAADDDDQEEEPQTNGVKRQRVATKSATPAAPATKRKAAPKAPAKPKAPKTKAKINDVPSDRLDVYVFGTGEQGELGLGSAKGQTEVKRPRLNPKLASDNIGVVTMDVGGMHAAVLTHDNKILTWGVNDNGALGRETSNWQPPLRDMNDDASDEDSDAGSDTGINPMESTPTEIDLTLIPEGTVWTQLVATDSATFALTNDGLVYGWGTFRVSYTQPPITTQAN